MQLQLQSFNTLVQNMAAAVQSAATGLIDLTVGSTLRATLEAAASVALWMQWLILLLLQTTRAATSAAADLDTWMADFALPRLPAAASAGTVTFARFTSTQPALVPSGTLARTADGTQSFAVTADTSNAAWSAAQNGYTIAAGATSVDVPVVAQVPGTAGNVLAGSIALIASAVPGIDTVSNAAALRGGIDAEADAAFRARFLAYINSRSLATPNAVRFAVASIQQNLACTIQENVDPAGSRVVGSFVVTVDDGSGTPSTAVLAAAAAAIDGVRPVGAIYAVRPPTVLTANVSLTLEVAPGATKSQVAGPVGVAVTAWINALPIGGALAVSRLAQLAHDADPNVAAVGPITINGGTADVAATASQVIKAGTVAVN